MNEKELVKVAANYLAENNIPYVYPGSISRVKDGLIEIVFLVPEALDPNVVVDPPDVRLWVNSTSMEVELVPQM